MGRLWRHADFRRLWAGETVEWLTDSISTVGIPALAVLFFKAGPLQTGLLYALSNAAYPLLGVFAGVMVDRWRRRPVLVWTNVIQFLALGSIPLAFFLRILSLIQLFIVTFVMSLTTVFFNIAYTAYLPTLISRDNVVEGNSKLETSLTVSAVVGPGIASALFRLVQAAAAIAIDALGTLFAAATIYSIRQPEPHPPPNLERHFFVELREGVKIVSENSYLRSLAECTSILNLGNGMFWGVFWIFVYDRLNVSLVTAPIVYAIAGVGGVIGAVLAPTALKRIGLGPSLIVALLINGLGLLAIQAAALGPVIVLLSALWFTANVGIPIYNINQVSFRQNIVPDRLQGRMNATMRTFGYGAATLGGLIGGLLGAWYGTLSVLTLGPLIALTAVAVMIMSPVAKLKTIPKDMIS